MSKKQTTNELDRIFSNFVMLRNGLKDHIMAGYFNAIELGVYTFIHMFASWEYKVFFTNAQGITTLFSNPGVTLRQVQDGMQNLRKNGYISYPVGGAGKGQMYPVLIPQAEPTKGVLKGSRLIGFGDNEMQTIVYEFSDASRAHEVLKLLAEADGERAHDVGCTCAVCAQPVCISVSIKEVKLNRMPKFEKVERIQEVKGEDEENASAPSLAQGHGA